MSSDTKPEDKQTEQAGVSPVSSLNILLAGRLAVISFFMGLVVFFQFRHGALAKSLPALLPVASAYLLSIIYATAARFIKNIPRFIYVQLIIDIILITGTLYFTGGADSPFTFLYIFVIIGAAILISKPATYVMASTASALYAGMVNLEFFQLIQPYHIFPPAYKEVNAGYLFLTAVMNISFFYLVAWLSGYLTGLYRKTDLQLIKKSQDFTELEAFNKNVLTYMGSGFLAADLDGTILRHNPAAERILGLESKEIDRANISKALCLPSIARVFTEDPDELGELTRQYDWTFTKKDGNEASLNMTISRLAINGETKALIAVFQDLTNLKQMERQVANAERLAAIGRVAAGIAHEIRNPLASLSGSIQMLSADMDHLLDQSGKRLINIITREADRLNRIITQFLVYASPPQPKPSLVDLSLVLNETVTLFRADPRGKDRLEIETHIEPALMVNVDQEQVRQVIWNLLVNALEAMEEKGKITLTALTEQYQGKTHPALGALSQDCPLCVRISIKDNGVGISPENLERIFEPFFSTKMGGTGFGLPTAHKIIESHKGKIKVASHPGRGTTFTIWLPGAKTAATVA
ncbi:MAG: PAS domain S-box protein [Nitrospinae bacterium]|nr:PAS domain S-box protein [Nitrospinota bacterium]